RLPTIPGADKAVLLTSAGNSSSNSRSSYGDIFAEQLGVTLSLNNNINPDRNSSPKTVQWLMLVLMESSGATSKSPD
ncbi:MAG: hypothetical protein R3248_04805, partial [Candidatus Promineifilaceae bacterium]|nr:hypothetical protein [Candidatus Promineifilaceae bacterium]